MAEAAPRSGASTSPSTVAKPEDASVHETRELEETSAHEAFVSDEEPMVRVRGLARTFHKGKKGKEVQAVRDLSVDLVKQARCVVLSTLPVS